MAQKGVSLGRVVNDGGTAVLLSDVDVQLLQLAGVRTVRVELRLASHTTWDDTIIGLYRTALQKLVAAGISVLALVGPALVPGATQTAWNQNNTETNAGASATNPFIDSLISALGGVVLALGDLVESWELWNEPNCYWARSGPVYTGGSYLYPSLIAGLLQRAFPIITGLMPHAGVITGGLFGHDIGGTLSSASSGADYFNALCKELSARGVGAVAAWPWTSPGQHLYLDQGGALTPGRVTTYLGYLTHVLTTWKVPPAQSTIIMTEGAWTTRQVTAQQQADNLAALFKECDTPAVSRAYWFLLHDNVAATLYYGLRGDGPTEPLKPAYSVFQMLP